MNANGVYNEITIIDIGHKALYPMSWLTIPKGLNPVRTQLQQS